MNDLRSYVQCVNVLPADAGGLRKHEAKSNEADGCLLGRGSRARLPWTLGEPPPVTPPYSHRIRRRFGTECMKPNLPHHNCNNPCASARPFDWLTR